MRKKFLMLPIFLIMFKTGIAQHSIKTCTSSIRFDKDMMVYKNDTRYVLEGLVYIFDSSSNTLYKCTVKDSSFNIPFAIFGKKCWVALFYNGNYYYTNIIKMDSLIYYSKTWRFKIEESKISKTIFGTYYVALLFSPFEYGYISFNNKYLYHKQGKRKIKSAEKKQMISY